MDDILYKLSEQARALVVFMTSNRYAQVQLREEGQLLTIEVFGHNRVLSPLQKALNKEISKAPDLEGVSCTMETSTSQESKVILSSSQEGCKEKLSEFFDRVLVRQSIQCLVNSVITGPKKKEKIKVSFNNNRIYIPHEAIIPELERCNLPYFKHNTSGVSLLNLKEQLQSYIGVGIAMIKPYLTKHKEKLIESASVGGLSSILMTNTIQGALNKLFEHINIATSDYFCIPVLEGFLAKIYIVFANNQFYLGQSLLMQKSLTDLGIESTIVDNIEHDTVGILSNSDQAMWLATQATEVLRELEIKAGSPNMRSNIHQLEPGVSSGYILISNPAAQAVHLLNEGSTTTTSASFGGGGGD